MAKKANREGRMIPAAQLVGVTIAAGESLSNALDCSTMKPMRCRMPTGWDSAAGAMPVATFQCSPDNVSFLDMFNEDGTEVVVVVVPNSVVVITSDIGAGLMDSYIKVRAGRRDTPAVQSAARTFTFVLGVA